ncbi:hypothetical protein [Granulibacter bethesdensis]|uniref:Hemolysin n=1 Tax=Granulibacter bethesdensis (strain ATCC BAA-1260 / CGDNIH1) TaxID=391165 RepID=Q0BRJ2_GRABC|nr:hypothetical protein [Granulibacter bethesdensis]ABI62560.1 Hemolysin [Granulibacter bethesdensis CGDNIH1]APH52412.1 Hemolysin [Granulibacter bethesdensis]APH65102.1 Hemolysin [Granulibacter bethesdensis]
MPKKRIHRRFPSSIKIEKSIDFVGLYYDNEGFRVHISDFSKEKSEIFVINFGAMVLAHRCMDEGKYLSLEAIADVYDYPDSPIVIVENSDFLEWFHNESLNLYIKDTIFHVMILTQDDWIDVLCLNLPKINIIYS